jgi:hypothetical protein
MQQQHRKTVRAEAPTTTPHQLLHRRERRKAVSTRDEHHLSLDKGRRCKLTMNQTKRLNGRTRNLLGGQCLLGSKCPASCKCPASSRDQPHRKYPWRSVGGWNVPRDKPLDTQPPPSKQPVLLTDRNEMVRQSRTRASQQRADTWECITASGKNISTFSYCTCSEEEEKSPNLTVWARAPLSIK